MASHADHLFNIARKTSDKQLFIIISIMIITLTVDTTVIKISDLTLKSTSQWITVVFAVISAISLVGQNLILRFTRQRVRESKIASKDRHLYLIEKIATIVHYSLAVIIVTVILQMFLMSNYNVVMLTAALTISYGFAIATMVLLGGRFLSWFRVKRTYLVLLYGLSAVMIAANAVVSLYLVDSILLDKPTIIMPRAASLQNPPIYPSSSISLVNAAYIFTTIASFIVTWAATAVLLSTHYTKKMERLRYRIVLGLPLVYFASQFLAVALNLLGPLFISDPVFFGILFTLIFTLSKPIGGVIFGIAFWTLTRKISKGSMVRSYIIISACGFILLFASNQAMVLAFVPYPPFGLASISFVGLASYLVLVGIYSSALSVSHDANLRHEIRKIAIKESKLLDTIGMAQMENELKSRTLGIIESNKNAMVEGTGIESSLTEDDIEQYLDSVLKEIKSKKEAKDTLA
jgi:MFS family permease